MAFEYATSRESCPLNIIILTKNEFGGIVYLAHTLYNRYDYGCISILLKLEKYFTTLTLIAFSSPSFKRLSIS